jgi:serine/threonine-protein phosphatase 6 regulatory ankyrin repeat subunit B
VLIQERLASGVDVNERSVDGTTALHWSVYKGDLALVNTLLERGADPDATNDYGATPMSTAAESGSHDILEAMLAAGGDVDSPNREGQTLLMAVARTGNTDTARLLLERGAKVNTRENWGGQSALMWAASQQQPAMVKLLIEYGADADDRSKAQDWQRRITSEPRIKPQLDPGGYTPLLYAAREGCVGCVEALLEGGADINLTDLWGRTPLIMALENLHYDTAGLLIERGADVKRWDWWGRTALYSAIDLHRVPASRRGDMPSMDTLTALDIARVLLEKGAYVDMRLKQAPPFRSDPGDRGYTDGSPDSRVLNAGATALHKAAKEGDVQAVKLLLQYDARVDLPNRVYGVTPILTAAGVWRVYGIFMDNPISGAAKTQDEAIEIITLLLEAGASIHDRASNGQTVAHGAAEAGWTRVLEFLYQRGADLSLPDIAGDTPRDLALAGDYSETVAFIDTLQPGREE